MLTWKSRRQNCSDVNVKCFFLCLRGFVFKASVHKAAYIRVSCNDKENWPVLSRYLINFKNNILIGNVGNRGFQLDNARFKILLFATLSVVQESSLCQSSNGAWAPSQEAGWISSSKSSRPAFTWKYIKDCTVLKRRTIQILRKCQH